MTTDAHACILLFSLELVIFNYSARSRLADLRLVVVAVRAYYDERVAICTEGARLTLTIVTARQLEFGVGPLRAKITMQFVHETEFGLFVLWFGSLLLLATFVALLVFLGQLDAAMLQIHREYVNGAAVTGACEPLTAQIEGEAVNIGAFLAST